MTSPSDDEVNLDELQLRAQGHIPQLPRRFSFMSLLAFGFAIMNSWIGFVSLLLTSLSLGGPPAAFWSTIVACVAAWIIAAGLAELASAFPSSGGQYHFTFMVAPIEYRAPLAFVTGWLSVLAYLFATSSGAIFIAESVVGLAEVYHPGYHAETWHVWLVFAAVIITAFVAVTIAPSIVPKTQSLFFWTSVLGVTAITVTLLAVSPSKQSAATTFTAYQNSSGWPSGMSFMLAVGQSMWSFSCIDSATHIAEEIPQPGKYVPRAMMIGMALGLITSIGFSLAIIFSATDFQAIAASPSPMYEAYGQAMQSTEGATVFAFILIFIYYGAALGLMTTTGRLIWAFSRDGGLPFSRVFERIDEKRAVPVNSNLLSCVFCLAYGLIYIGSEVAFNVFISSAILFMNLSYTIPQAVLLFRGNRREVLVARHFDLGNVLGVFCNVFAVLWMGLYTVIFCFPLALPTNAKGMSYVSVVLAGALLFVAALWFLGGKRRTFIGPVTAIDALEAVNIASTMPMGKLDRERASESAAIEAMR
ncbi:hypothetical protein FE257_004796 [Aspergillus nanangensis]|uniref:Uncharacterized protein n=1 Tax=Aspergillus nanangensis TaxID=2582783 RepID=A0AAD4CRR0_ASPNN|nr:hypothetical protein FE257_004796 [Aspergillus nanangensis]